MNKKILFFILGLLFISLASADYKRDIYDYQGSWIREKLNYSKIVATNLTGNSTWEHQSYPGACPVYSAVTEIGDSNVCADYWVNTGGDNMTGNLDMTDNKIYNVSSMTITQILVNDTDIFDIINESGYNNSLWESVDGVTRLKSAENVSFQDKNVSGIDYLLVKDINVTGDIDLIDVAGHEHNLNYDMHFLDELQANVFLTPLNVSTFTNETGDYINITTTFDENISVNIGTADTASVYNLAYDRIILELNHGTNETPVLNRVYIKLVGDTPTWEVSISDPTMKHAMVARVLLGANYTYGASLQEDNDNGVIKRTQRRFRKEGLLYESGLNYTGYENDLQIEGGTFINGIYDTTIGCCINITQGFYLVHSDGEYKQYINFSNITEYSDGSSIGVNKYFNVIFGIVPYDGSGRIYAVVQREPKTEYTSTVGAYADNDNTLLVYPSEHFLKTFFLPVARMIIKKSPTNSEAQLLPNGYYAEDYRGGVAGGAQSGGGISEADPLSVHIDGTTPLTGDWDVGGYNITNVGYLEVGNDLKTTGDLNVTEISYLGNIFANNYSSESGRILLGTSPESLFSSSPIAINVSNYGGGANPIGMITSTSNYMDIFMITNETTDVKYYATISKVGNNVALQKNGGGLPPFLPGKSAGGIYYTTRDGGDAGAGGQSGNGGSVVFNLGDGGAVNGKHGTFEVHTLGEIILDGQLNITTNITLTSPNGTGFNCGVADDGTFSCS